MVKSLDLSILNCSLISWGRIRVDFNSIFASLYLRFYSQNDHVFQLTDYIKTKEDHGAKTVWKQTITKFK